jgi:hypothetical protein
MRHCLIRVERTPSRYTHWEFTHPTREKDLDVGHLAPVVGKAARSAVLPVDQKAEGRVSWASPPGDSTW